VAPIQLTDLLVHPANQATDKFLDLQRPYLGCFRRAVQVAAGANILRQVELQLVPMFA